MWTTLFFSAALLAHGSPRTISEAEVNNLCFAVAEQVRESEGSAGTPFVYQAILYTAAGIQASDQPETIRASMQQFWVRNQDRLYCNELNSALRETHLLRLAIDRNANEFLNDVVRRWRVDLNHIDRRSGGTVLDFVDVEIRKATGTPREGSLLRYRKMLESAGARRAKDA